MKSSRVPLRPVPRGGRGPPSSASGAAAAAVAGRRAGGAGSRSRRSSTSPCAGTARSHAAGRVIRRNTNRRHMIGDHHRQSAGRATLLVRAVDAILGTHTRNFGLQRTTAPSQPPAPPAQTGPPRRRALPGADNAPPRPRRPPQRIRTGRVKAQVRAGGRVPELRKLRERLATASLRKTPAVTGGRRPLMTSPSTTTRQAPAPQYDWQCTQIRDNGAVRVVQRRSGESS